MTPSQETSGLGSKRYFNWKPPVNLLLLPIVSCQIRSHRLNQLLDPQVRNRVPNLSRQHQDLFWHSVGLGLSAAVMMPPE